MDSDIEILGSQPGPPPRRSPNFFDIDGLLNFGDDFNFEDFMEVDRNDQQRQEDDRMQSRLRLRRQREDQRRMRQEALRRNQRQESRPPAQDGDVIDLTEEPDSPVNQVAQPAPVLPHLPGHRISRAFLDHADDRDARRRHRHHHHHIHHHHHHHGDPQGIRNHSPESQGSGRHPRRQMSGLGRTPSLSRGDASINAGRGGGAPEVIDLTEIDDAPPAPLQPPAPADMPHRVFGAPLGPPDPHMPRLAIDYLSRAMRQLPRLPHIAFDYAVLNIGVGVGVGIDLNNHAQAAPPKPAYSPREAAPDGFSNDTGEETVAICPGCDEELVYDPDFVPPLSPASKKAKTKKAHVEHHFMAVKACGHVFCRKCFDNRKAKGKTSNFKLGPKANVVLCAVKDCTSDVSQPKSWLGFFT